MTASDVDTLIIGIGNPLRCDDGAGPAVVQRLLEQALPLNVKLIQHHGEGASLIDAWQGYRRVILMDATRSGAAVGSVQRFDAAQIELPRGLFSYSSHLFGVAEAVELARSLARLPDELIIYGIAGAVFDYGEDLSPEVAVAVVSVASRIRAELEPIRCLSELSRP